MVVKTKACNMQRAHQITGTVTVSQKMGTLTSTKEVTSRGQNCFINGIDHS